jgi:hypothetical protein
VDLCTVEQAAQELGVDASVLYDSIRLGQLPCEDSGNNLYLRRVDVDRLKHGLGVNGSNKTRIGPA